MTNEFDDADMLAAERLFQRIRDQSTIAGQPGVTRPSYSTSESTALRTLEEFAHENDLDVLYDRAANVWFDERGKDPGLDRIWIGSHVDSVPQGGNFDGLAGVAAGLLCLRKIHQRKLELPKPVRVVAIRGEESAWFGVPYLGAKALFGQLTKSDLVRNLRQTNTSLLESMLSCGADVRSISDGKVLVDPDSIVEYWELHIEQGPVLVNEREPIGIVSGIRGNVRYGSIEIVGREGHSGTVPRELRNDAVFAFAELVSTLDRDWEAMLESDDLVVTCGIVETDRAVHGITRIPGSVRFCLEFRSLRADVLEIFERTVLATMKSVELPVARRTRTTRRGVRTPPARLDEKLCERALSICAQSNRPIRSMPSGAGHDAAVFANAGIPTGMIFVRNENGSHNPDEAMDMRDFMRGVEVLYKAVTASAR